jgi:hypothetical protein
MLFYFIKTAVFYQKRINFTQNSNVNIWRKDVSSVNSHWSHIDLKIYNTAVEIIYVIGAVYDHLKFEDIQKKDYKMNFQFTDPLLFSQTSRKNRNNFISNQNFKCN